MSSLFENLLSRRCGYAGPISRGDGVGRSRAVGLHYGFPFPGSFPLAELARGAADALECDGEWACQYGGGALSRRLSELVLAHLEGRGLHTAGRSLLITNGAAQALDLIGATLIDPGDPVAVEAPTFMGALSCFSTFGPEFIPLPLDAQGLQVEALQERLQARRTAGLALPKLVYVIPSFHNPTGATMPDDRRARLLDLAQNYGFAIVEDDAYGDLHFGQPPPATLQSRDPDGHVVYVGTLSKVIAPGVRLGWVLARPELVARLEQLKGDGDTNPLVQSLVASYWAQGSLERRIRMLRDAYRQRWLAMEAALRKHLPPDITYTRAEGGFFSWVSLPAGTDDGEVAARALARGVRVLPGHIFFPPGAADPGLRLSFSFEAAAELEQGVARLGSVLSEL